MVETTSAAAVGDNNLLRIYMFLELCVRYLCLRFNAPPHL